MLIFSYNEGLLRNSWRLLSGIVLRSRIASTRWIIKGRPRTLFHIFTECWPILFLFTVAVFRKFAVKRLLKIPPCTSQQWGSPTGEHRRWDDRGAAGADGGRCGEGYPPSQPTRGSGGASRAPPAGTGAEPRPQTHFSIFLGHRAALAEGKCNIFCPTFSVRLNSRPPRPKLSATTGEVVLIPWGLNPNNSIGVALIVYRLSH